MRTWAPAAIALYKIASSFDKNMNRDWCSTYAEGPAEAHSRKLIDGESLNRHLEISMDGPLPSGPARG